MAKKYHNPMSSRVKRLERHEEAEHGVDIKKLGSAFYDSMDTRKRLEVEDSHMIREDRMAMANLPQNVIIKEYPKTVNAQYPELNDTLSGIDEQNMLDARKTKHDRFPSKY